MFDGVELCASTFDATPIRSREPVWDADIGEGYDLIWSGSLLTHLPEEAWDPTLRHLASALAPGGVIVFTTHGRLALAFLRNEPAATAHLGAWLPARYGLTGSTAEAVAASAERRGFGYAAYPGAEKRADGLSISLGDWVERLLASTRLDVCC
ncbi:MAG: class I SAM-dependent methyltransferase [Acidimicrobiales bacterium]